MFTTEQVLTSLWEARHKLTKVINLLNYRAFLWATTPPFVETLPLLAFSFFLASTKVAKERRSWRCLVEELRTGAHECSQVCGFDKEKEG